MMYHPVLGNFNTLLRLPYLMVEYDDITTRVIDIMDINNTIYEH